MAETVALPMGVARPVVQLGSVAPLPRLFAGSHQRITTSVPAGTHAIAMLIHTPKLK